MADYHRNVDYIIGPADYNAEVFQARHWVGLLFHSEMGGTENGGNKRTVSSFISICRSISTPFASVTKDLNKT